MLKKYRKQLIISSVIILLPMLAGLVMWGKLPGTMAIHWGVSGQANGWGGRIAAVFVLPLVMLALQWFGVWLTSLDRRNQSQSEKVVKMVLWIIPAVTLFVSGFIYTAAMGRTLHMEAFVFAVLGLMFLVFGNYMPKCKQNLSIGIKIKWTLQNEENWNATHRLTGRVWFVSGLLMLLGVFLPPKWAMGMMCAVLLVSVAVPLIYSYSYYRRQLKEGTAKFTPIAETKKQRNIALAVTAIALVLCAVLIFTGNIEVVLEEDSFTVKATYGSDLTVAYEAIDTIEYVENVQTGRRVFGFGGGKLNVGTFANDAYGNYTLYGYSGCDAAAVITSEGKTLVIIAEDAQTTLAICEQIKAHME